MSDYAKCPRCQMGCVIPSMPPNWPAEPPEPPLFTTKQAWLDQHECPEPYPRETAEFLARHFSSPNTGPISPRMRARIILGLESGSTEDTET